jgi:hypothetical protein
MTASTYVNFDKSVPANEDTAPGWEDRLVDEMTATTDEQPEDESEPGPSKDTTPPSFDESLQ